MANKTIGDILGQAKGRGNLQGVETVMRNLNKEIAAIKGRTLKGLIRAQIIIRRDMETTAPVIPVETGNLRSSYFTVTSNEKIAAGMKRSATGGFKGKDAARLAGDHSATMSTYASTAKSRGIPNVIMGFSAYYAAYVHEMVGAQNWSRESSGAKFFESSIQRNSGAVLRMIAEEAKIQK